MSDFDEQLYKLLFDEDYEFDADDEAEDPDYKDIVEDHEDDEFDPVEASDEEPSTSRSHFIGKDGTEWQQHPIVKPGRSQKFAQKIYVPGPDKEAKAASTPLDYWKLLFSDAMMEIIHEQTNKEIRDRAIERAKLGKPSESYHRETTRKEIYALFGLLYLIGVQKNSKTNVNELWSSKNGITVFRATMSEQRFRFLLACVRFDDRTTRDDRKKEDNFAGIRKVWSIFIKNCTSNYSPAHNMTIDEQLMNFRGNCPFRRYMPKKPAKYGMKVIMLNDTSTSYMYNAIPEVGRPQIEKKKAAAEKEEKKREREESASRSKAREVKKTKTGEEKVTSSKPTEKKKPKTEEKKEKKEVGSRSKSAEKNKPKTEAEKEKERKEKQEKQRLANLEKEYAASGKSSSSTSSAT
jgi:flagellar biosynthesis GTPase FlhF